MRVPACTQAFDDDDGLLMFLGKPCLCILSARVKMFRVTIVVKITGKKTKHYNIPCSYVTCCSSSSNARYNRGIIDNRGIIEVS